MVRRYFFDCDDTLVLWQEAYQNGDADGEYYNTPYTINQKLVDAIMFLFKNDPDAPIFIWSGGGSQYAEYWRQELGLPGIAITKDQSTFGLVQEGDIVVDDEPIKVRTHSPKEWF